MYSNKQKEEISKLLISAKEKSSFTSSAQFARTMDLSPADYSNITNYKWKETPHLVGDKKWNRLAFALNYKANGQTVWATANTYVRQFIHTQLKAIKEKSITGILVEDAGTGKTDACKAFASMNENVFYINCSEAPSKSAFVRAMAKSMGLKASRNTEDTFTDIISYVNSIKQPLLILDEAGDLQQPSIIMVKRIYNSTEFQLGMYLVGARGLEIGIDKGVRLRKNGYEEVYSRLGSKFIHIFDKVADKKKKLRNDFISVIKAQGITDDETISRILEVADDLRKVRREVLKYQKF